MQNQQQELETLRERIEILQEENLQLKNLLKPEFQTPKEWQLTPYQRDLFKALLSRDIASREFIYNVIYFDKQKQVDIKIIDVLINTTRKKLKPFGVVITTIHSNGYSLQYRQAWADRLMPSPSSFSSEKGH